MRVASLASSSDEWSCSPKKSFRRHGAQPSSFRRHGAQPSSFRVHSNQVCYLPLDVSYAQCFLSVARCSSVICGLAATPTWLRRSRTPPAVVLGEQLLPFNLRLSRPRQARRQAAHRRARWRRRRLACRPRLRSRLERSPRSTTTTSARSHPASRRGSCPTRT